MQVLGAVGVTVDGDTRTISSRSQRVVLSMLAARPNLDVPVDLLVDALWPETPPRTAVSSLRTYVSRLRGMLGQALVGTPGSYRLTIEELDLDLLCFERLLDDAATAAPAVALDLIEDAVALWRGSPFGDVGDVDPIRAVTARLEERWVTAREDRAVALLSCGRASDAVAATEELIADHPLRERVWVTLIEALTQTARPTEALRAYQRAVDALADAGLEPTAELRRAETVALASETDTPARRTVALPPSSFVDRPRDRAELARLTASWPIVTLVGPGGVGKTRLARTVAADIEHRFAAGVRVIELAGVDDAVQVAAVVADKLGLVVGPDGPFAALESVGDLDLLVMIDNCEHVIDAVARLVVHLTSGGRRLRILATSREPLAVDGEQRWPVDPLPVSGSDSGVQLFIERVRSARPAYSPNNEELALIAEIVERLDGLPLAIEMAAAAAGTMPVTKLHQRLEDELELPALKRRDLDERQRTLKALLDWSLRLLDDEARSMFRSLSVFAGAVTEDDVAHVSGHGRPLEALCRLVDHSLVQVDTTGDESHFGMLRTVRQRAREAASEDLDSLRRRHAGWLLEAVTSADRRLRSPDERVAHDRLERLLDDARVAVGWARDHDATLSVQLTGRMYLYGQTRLRDEVLGWAAETVDAAPEALSGPDGELALAAAAHRAINSGDLDRARRLVERAVGLNSAAAHPLVFEILSDVHLFAGNTEGAREAARSGLVSASDVGDPHGIVVCLTNLVLADAYAGDHQAAARTAEAFTAPAELAPSDRGWLHYVEGERMLDLDSESALTALNQAATSADAVGNGYLATLARVSYASLLSRTGDPAVASGPFAELVAHWRTHGDRTHLLTTLRNLVVLLDRLRMPEQAAELLGAVLGDAVAPTFGTERRMLEAVLDRLERTLGSPELGRRMAAGRDRTVDDAARLAQQWLEESTVIIGSTTGSPPEPGPHLRRSPAAAPGSEDPGW